MFYQPHLQHGRFIKRYKRFLVDIVLDNGDLITMHCPNTGSMKNCCYENASAWFSLSNNPKRKYANTWEQIQTPQGHRIGVNTHKANALLIEAIQLQLIPEFRKYRVLETEVSYGEENSRIDILLTDENKNKNFIEVKSVTLMEQGGVGYFPDAVSKRAHKHLRELIKVVESGHKATVFFCVQHTGIKFVKPAVHIDSEYENLLKIAIRKGVRVLAWGCALDESEIKLTHPINVLID